MTWQQRFSAVVCVGVLALAWPSFPGVVWCQEASDAEQAATESSDAELHLALRKQLQGQMQRGSKMDVLGLRSIGDQLRELANRSEDITVALTAREDASVVDRALTRLLIQKSRLAFSDEEQQATLKEAREFIERAQTLCAKRIEMLHRELEQSVTEADEEEQAKWKKTLAAAQPSQGLIWEETADAYTAGMDQRQEALGDAKSAYEKVYQQHRTALVGVYAQLYGGRVAGKLKEYEESMAAFESLLRLPDKPIALETVKLKAAILLADCRLEQEEVDLSGEASRLRKHLRGLSPALQNSSDARGLRKRIMTIESRLAEVAAVTEQPELPAVDISTDEEDDELSPEDQRKNAEYQLASAKVKEAIARYQTASTLVQTVKLRLKDPAGEDDDAPEGQDEDALEKAEAAVQEAIVKSIEACGKMLELGDPGTGQRPTALPLYYLSYFHFTSGDYVTTLLYAEDLARNQPKTQVAPKAAQIAAASYLQLRKQTLNAAEKNQFLRQFVAIQAHTIKTWPQSKEAEKATAMLQQIKAAQEAAQAIPQEQPPS